MVDDAELLQGFSKCRDLGALPQVRTLGCSSVKTSGFMSHMENTSHNQLAVLTHVDKGSWMHACLRRCMPRTERAWRWVSRSFSTQE